MIDRSTFDPGVTGRAEPRNHRALVQQMARSQARLARSSRAAPGAPGPTLDPAGAHRLAWLADAQKAAAASLGAAGRQRALERFELAVERLFALRHLAAAARATDLHERTRGLAETQFKTLKLQALEAVREGASLARAAGAWPLRIDPSEVGLALTPVALAPGDAGPALDRVLGMVEQLRDQLAAAGAPPAEATRAETLDSAGLARRIARQAALSLAAQANVAPANARILLS